MIPYSFALLEMILDALYMLQNVGFYREAQPISATQPRENEEAAVTGSSRSVGCTMIRPWSVLESDFYSFFALRSWHSMNDHRRGQNTAIKGQMLAKKTKNPAKHIKQLHLSINREWQSK